MVVPTRVLFPIACFPAIATSTASSVPAVPPSTNTMCPWAHVPAGLHCRPSALLQMVTLVLRARAVLCVKAMASINSFAWAVIRLFSTNWLYDGMAMPIAIAIIAIATTNSIKLNPFVCLFIFNLMPDCNVVKFDTIYSLFKNWFRLDGIGRNLRPHLLFGKQRPTNGGFVRMSGKFPVNCITLCLLTF